MQLTQLQANPATMLIFAALNSDANTLGNNNNSAFTAEFDWYNYTFKVRSVQDRLISITLAHNDFTLINIKRPIGHGMEDAVAAILEFCGKITKLAQEHLKEVDLELFCGNFEECQARFSQTFTEVLKNFKDAEVEWLDCGYYRLLHPANGIMHISNDQYELYRHYK